LAARPAGSKMCRRESAICGFMSHMALANFPAPLPIHRKTGPPQPIALISMLLFSHNKSVSKLIPSI